MAQYKVPQDVEADDKLLGPFSFRQFVYLLIAAGLIALTVGLFQLFPLLAILPLPPIFLFLVLALPLKKDQPMETYLAALVSYYLKPRTRIWTPGQRESTILITAPKIVEEVRTRDITGEEATHRLSFLADIVDTEGQSIKGANSNSSMREDLIAEANATTDMFDSYQSEKLEQAIEQNKAKAVESMQGAINQNSREDERKRALLAAQEAAKREAERKRAEEHAKAIESMRGAILRGEELDMSGAKIQNNRGSITANEPEEKEAPKKVVTNQSKPSIMELANNTDYTVATIAKEANRINRKDEGEIFISLH